MTTATENKKFLCEDTECPTIIHPKRNILHKTIAYPYVQNIRCLVDGDIS